MVIKLIQRALVSSRKYMYCNMTEDIYKFKVENTLLFEYLSNGEIRHTILH